MVNATMYRTARHPFRAAVLLAAAVILLCLPAGALASVQVSVQGWDLPGAFDPPAAVTVVGTNGVDDAYELEFVPNTNGAGDDQVRITSTSGPITDSDGADVGACNAAGSVVVCDLYMVGNATWILTGNGGNDSIIVSGPAHTGYDVWIFGGFGNDTLVGGAGIERFFGDDGAGGSTCFDLLENPAGTQACNDTIRDGLGRDLINGEGGSDINEQSALAGSAPDLDEDDINLADGSADRVTYAAREASNAVTIRLPNGDGIDNDPGEAIDASGTPGEEDDLQNGLEQVIGTAGNDSFRVRNSAASVVLDGGAGNDEFLAGPSSERFIGGTGTDTVSWADVLGEWGISGIAATADGIANDGDADLSELDDLGADVEQVIGSSGDDTMLGAAITGCRIAGGSGDDMLDAAASGCILEGGNGIDVLTGAAGNDVLRPGGSGTVSSDQLTFGGGTDAVDYGSVTLVGTDLPVNGVLANATAGASAWCYGLGVGVTSARKTVAGQTHLDRYNDSPERIVGTQVSDTLCGGGSGTVLEGRAAADSLLGGAGNDTLLGGDGSDVLNGQGGSDSLSGEAGADHLNGGAGTDTVDGGAGDDPHVRGGGGSDTILGGDGSDVLDEVVFSTIMQGQAGEEDDAGDVLDGGPGTDVVDGSGGDDRIVCSASMLVDTISDSGGGTETIDCSAYAAAITFTAGAGIDAIIGTAFADRIGGASSIEGRGGDDTITGSDAGSTLDGGDGADTVNGGASTDTLRGGGGSDSVSGGSGDDVVEGGSGNDTLVGGDGTDALDGGTGSDSLGGGSGNDTLEGGAGGDVLGGGGGVDQVSYAARDVGVSATIGSGSDDGQAGEGDSIAADVEVVPGSPRADTLVAGAAGTTLRGGGGNDVLGGGVAADSLDGGDGDDVLAGAIGADSLAGGAGFDTATYASRAIPVTVTVGAGANDGQKGEGDDVQLDIEQVLGGRGKDTLTGAAGSQTLRGGPGNDILTGGVGRDSLFGDAGNDLLRSKDRINGEQVDGGTGRDRAQVDARDRVKRVETRLR